MKVKVRLFALYRELAGESELEIEVKAATTAHLWDVLRKRYPRLGKQSPLMAVNGEFAQGDEKLKGGDEVAFLPPFSGGASGVRLTTEPLEAQAIADSLMEEAHGALVVFQGVVRRWTEGRRVLHLEYEAYEPMAGRKLEEIRREMKERWGVDSALHHRLGRLEVGEVSLVVAVVAPHRQEAFAACQHAVDRIKETVPIWKKEVFTDGEVWAGPQD
ncbi:MAG: MoaD family protein [Chloroflexi bacterium]|nr:MoaD family protein [Chloroflexota bacterium]